ncbi:stage II sporulation protein M [Candidatus Woesearchaeota archaeon]|nr:MAG: stage II sporulation protein M [Candidatus Woesearchaeota archaeon]
MVLEKLLPERVLERRPLYAFIVGIVYSVVGIFLAKLLFPEDPALVSVAFISLLILPELYKLFSTEERKEKAERRITLKNLYKDNKDLLRLYLVLFFSIFFTYAVLTMFLSDFESNRLFSKQLSVRTSTGNAADRGGLSGLVSRGIYCEDASLRRLPANSFPSMTCLYSKIFFNNLSVLAACFFLALITGDGAVFLITWNASVWGTIFGWLAKNLSRYFETAHPLGFFFTILAIVLPHMTLEALAYIMAAISGGTISKDVVLERLDSKRFNKVFAYNMLLLLVALLILLIAAGLETGVLTYSTTYQSLLRFVR